MLRIFYRRRKCEVSGHAAVGLRVLNKPQVVEWYSACRCPCVTRWVGVGIVWDVANAPCLLVPFFSARRPRRCPEGSRPCSAALLDCGGWDNRGRRDALTAHIGRIS